MKHWKMGLVVVGAVVVGTVAFVALDTRGWFNFARPAPAAAQTPATTPAQ